MSTNVANFASDLRANLRGTRFENIDWVERTGSTNADLLARAAEDQTPSLLGAEAQTAGRGRRDRRWEAPPGAGILMSMLVPRPIDRAQWTLPALAVAAVEAVRDHGCATAAIKWPNDLVVGDVGKLAGLLAESMVVGSEARVVAGIGLNVEWPRTAGEGPDGAVSMAMVGARTDRATLVVDIVRAFDGLLDASPADLRRRYARLCSTLGRRVRIEGDQGSYEAAAIDIGDDGQLVVDTDAGERREVTVADVVHLRTITPPKETDA